MKISGPGMRQRLERAYFTLLYSFRPPDIYYDSRFQVYVHPEIPDEHGALDWVCGELVRFNLIYPFEIDGQADHTHSFPLALVTAYNHPDAFRLSAENRGYYSQQELTWLDRVIQKGREDKEREIELVSLPISRKRGGKRLEAPRVLKETYGVDPSTTYYDPFQQIAYFAGSLLDDRSGAFLTDVVEYLGASSCIFPYCMDGKSGHQHDFDHVLLAAYRGYNSFSIAESDLHLYSPQQLEWIGRMRKKGQEDLGRR